MSSISQAGPAAKTNQGWDRLVQQLTSLDDPRRFLQGMLELQCKVVAAEYGGIFIPGQDGNAQILVAWPTQILQGGPDSPIIKLLQEAAKTGIEKGSSQILQIQPNDPGGTPDAGGAYVFVTPLKEGSKVAAVCAVAAECRDPQVLQATAPLREMAAGLYAGFVARRQAAEQLKDVERIRRAMAVLGILQEGEGFQGAAFNVVNELARQLACSRVSIGWVKGKGVKLVAMSDTEHLKRHSEQVATLELAMAECLDQQQPVVYPIPEGSEPLIAQAVVHAHRRVTGEHPSKYVISLPMRDKDDLVGALTLERSDEPFTADLVTQLQLVVDTLSPHLHDRKKSSRWLVGHTWASVEWAAAYLVGPKHVAWKLGAIAALILLTVFFFVDYPYKVTSDFAFEAKERRILPASFDGQLKEVYVTPGDRVEEGQLLAQLNTTELRLQLAQARSEREQNHVKWTQAKGKGEEDKAQEAQASVDKAQAQINLLEYQIEHAAIRSPITGHVLTGYWHDKIGGVVERGEQMFEVAPLSALTAVLKVDESDIDMVMQAYNDNETDYGLEGADGRLATRAHPNLKFRFQIYRIVPLAKPEEGNNYFEVRAHVIPAEGFADLRPGMEGIARVEVGEKPIYWIFTRKLVDYVRVWLWW